MFIMSMRMNKKRIIVLCMIVLFGLIGSIVGLKYITNGENNIKVSSSSNAENLEFKTQEDIKNYIKSFGWEIEDNPVEVVDVQVPNEFSDVYKNYNKIQKEQGFDLEKYKGKKVNRFTFVVLNYPDMPKNIRADVITYKNKIIAADICSVELDGFMYGIDSFPKQ